MNIFVTDANPVIAAQNQADKLLIKMVLEQAQLLCTAHRVVDGEKYKDGNKTSWVLADWLKDQTLYRATHINHPCAIWLRYNTGNYTWGFQHFVAMCNEYTHRFNKIHKCDFLFRETLEVKPINIIGGALTPFVKCMGASPESLAIEDPIEAYRHFYQTKQTRFKMIWTNREKPEWFKYTT